VQTNNSLVNFLPGLLESVYGLIGEAGEYSLERREVFEYTQFVSHLNPLLDYTRTLLGRQTRPLEYGGNDAVRHSIEEVHRRYDCRRLPTPLVTSRPHTAQALVGDKALEQLL
jgi:hypothetical protein